MTRSVVVLPEPEGPRSVKNSPSAMSRSSSSIATTSPYVRRIPVSRTAGVAAPASRSMRPLAGACVAKRLLEEAETALELLVCRGERRQQPDDVAVEAAREQDEPLLACGRGDGLRRLTVSLDELEREHRPEAAHLADDRIARGDFVEPCAQQAADLVAARAKAGSRQLVERRKRRRAADGITAEGAAEAARVHRVHQLGAAGHSGERQPAPERLAGDDQVGLHAVMLDGPHRARASAARLHLVV